RLSVHILLTKLCQNFPGLFSLSKDTLLPFICAVMYRILHISYHHQFNVRFSALALVGRFPKRRSSTSCDPAHHIFQVPSSSCPHSHTPATFSSPTLPSSTYHNQISIHRHPIIP